jgi:hypothetical protein
MKFVFNTRIPIIYVAVGILLAFILGFTIKPQTTNLEAGNKTETPLPSQEVTKTNLSTPEESVKTVVMQFENLQKARNADVLKLFTPSASPIEAEAYSSLVALDLPVHESPRLFMTAGYGYKLSEYTIREILKTDAGYRAEVEESRSSYDNTSGGWVENPKKIYLFELVNMGTNVMVDKYYPKNGKNGKYEGFNL